jgi:4-hydroxybenzoate polyprenyltransferase
MNAAPLLSVRFARAYLVTGRPYLCFVSGVTGLAGLAGARSLSPAAACVLGAVFFAAYAFGQALTDVTQLDTDRLSSPYRPLVRGEIRPRDVLLVSVSGLVLCALLIVAFDRRAAVAALVPALGLASYTPLKRRFWAGPIHNAWIVATLPILAALSDGRTLGALAADIELCSVTALAFFGYLTFVLLGYLKDVEADRATGYDTIAVRFGRRAAAAVSFVAALFAVAVARVVLVRADSALASLVGAFGAILLLAAHVKAWFVTRDVDAHPAIVSGLRGYVTLQVAVSIAQRPSLVPVGLLLLVGFEVALALRPCKAQV